jgi:hypothetical protein
MILELLVVASVAGVPPAPDPCADSVTLRLCVENALNGLRKESTEAEDEVNATKQDTIDKSDAFLKNLERSTESGRSVTVNRDSVAAMFASLGLGQTETTGKDLTLNLNTKFLSLGSWNPITPRVILHEPVVFPAALDSATDAQRGSVESALKKDLRDLDDVEISLSWRHESDHMGKQYLDRMWGEVFQDVVSLDPDELNELAKLLSEGNQQYLDKSIVDLQNERDAAPGDKKAAANQVLETATAIRKRAIELATKGRVIITNTREELLKGLKAVRFEAATMLVDNQPQAFVTGFYRKRGDVVGPDEFGAQVRWEVGFLNFNSFRRWCARSNKPEDGTRLGEYLGQFSSDALESQRAVLSVEYRETSSFDLALSDPSFTFHLDRVRTLTGSVTWGRFLNWQAVGPQSTRLDIEAKYESVTGDPKRNNRLVGTATFSQRLGTAAASPSASLTFVYANKPEYLPEVDKKWSAQFGLKFKVDEPSKSRGQPGAK